MPALTPRAAALVQYPRPEWTSPTAGSTVTPTEPLVWKSVARTTATHFYVETSTASDFTSPDTYRSDRGGFEYYSGSAWSAVPYTGVPSGVLAAYPYWRTITLDTTSSGANITSSLTNFPICVAVNSSSWATSGDRDKFFGTWNTDGKRVRFIDANGTSLAYEVEKYDAANQSAVYWVNVPTVAGNSTTVIAVGYGADPVGTDQSNGTAVWDSNFNSVYHFGGTALSVSDSTSNSNNATNQGGTAAAGVAGGGVYFQNANQYMTVLGSPTLSTARTHSFWLKAPATSTAAVVMFDMGTFSGGRRWALYCNNSDGLYGRTKDATIIEVYTDSNFSTGVVADSTWHYVAATLSTSNLSSSRVYRDGALSHAGSVNSVTINTTATTQYLNAAIDNQTAYGTLGTYDELRISKTARSADWIKAEYFSMKQTSWPGDGWLTFGTQQAVSGNVRLSTTLPTAAPLYARVRQSK